MTLEELKQELADGFDRVVNFKQYETFGRQPQSFGKTKKEAPVKSRLLEHKLQLRRTSLGNGIS